MYNTNDLSFEFDSIDFDLTKLSYVRRDKSRKSQRQANDKIARRKAFQVQDA